MADETEKVAQIRQVYADRMDAARRHAQFGRLFDEDMGGILKRTASLCQVTVDQVKEAVNA